MKTFHKFSLQLMMALIMFMALIGPAVPAQASSDTPSAGGQFIVRYNTVDNTDADWGLTLREALLLARGGTGSNGLNRPLESGESIYVSGCQMGIDGGSGKLVIVGGCGAGMTDTIVFGVYENQNVYHINSTLPAINDTAPTIINGEGTYYRPTLDFSHKAMTQGLTVNSDDNIIKGIVVRGVRCNNGSYCPALYGMALNGDNNEVSNVSVVNIQGDGISIQGKNNVVDNARVGVLSADTIVCPPLATNLSTGVTGDGIYLVSGAQNNTIKNSVIGCNGLAENGAGLYVSSQTDGSVIGPNNKIGANGNGSAAVLSNFGSGVVLSSSDGVQVISNTIGFNGDSGILVGSSLNNVIAGNIIRNNSDHGILLLGASANNILGGPTQGSPYGGNKIVLNGLHGILLQSLVGLPDIAPANNRIVGNWIGTLNVVDVAANKGSGIVLNGGRDNLIGDPASPAVNVIGGNDGQGLLFQNGAHDNKVEHNTIGTNGYTALPNKQNGILLEDGAHHNIIGGVTATSGNSIAYNNAMGMLLRDDGTASNIVISNIIAKNGVDGVMILDQAKNNSIGGVGLFGGFVNRIFDNGRTGVQIANGAQNNLVGGNDIYENNSAGVLFWGANTTDNTVQLAKIHKNKGGNGDGIAQVNGAANNSWSHISTYDNAGLGIDLNAASGQNMIDAPSPTITNITVDADTVTVTGEASPNLFGEQTVAVELYRVADDPSGHGEGQTYVGFSATEFGGEFTISFNGLAGCFTAFETVDLNGSKHSSEFGPNFCLGTPQSITFDAIPDQYVGDGPIAINPTASSGLPVSVVAEGQCTVAQNMVTLISAGPCTLTASQAGNATYAPAPDVIVQFEISKKLQSITWQMDDAALAKVVNDAPFQLDATASSGLPIHYLAQGVCTVNGNEVTLSGAPGLCTLTAQQAGNDEYYPAAEVQYVVTASKLDQSILFDPLPNKQTSDPAFAVDAQSTVLLPVSFGAAGVCTVDGSMVTLTGDSGLCTITASQSGDELYNPAPDVQQSFNVLSAAKQAQSITFGALADKTFGDAPFVVDATASSGLPVSFSSLTGAVCTLNGNEVTLSAPGLCTLQASQPGDATFNPAASVTQSFVVADPAMQTQTITFDALSDKLEGDAPFAIAPTASSGLIVAVVSKTPAVCTVATNLVTIVATGSCTLVASQPGDATFNPAAPVTRTFTVQALNQPGPMQVVYLPLITRLGD